MIPAIGMTAVIFLAAWLRFMDLGKLELWLDECGAVLMAVSPQGLLHELARDNNPPLYFLLLKGWIAAFGHGEFAVRAMSALIGTLTVAALGACLRSLGLPRRAVVWSMVLCAVAPLQIRYSQEARPYILTNFVLALALWSFVAALRGGRWWRWVLHAAALAAAFYTHDLMLSAVPALWLGAWSLGADRSQWRTLAVAHIAALAVYAPWFALVAIQPKLSALEWIVPLWRSIPPALAIPRSLEAFCIGGHVPPHVRLPAPGGWVRFAAVAWWALTGLAALACLLPARKEMAVQEAGMPQDQRDGSKAGTGSAAGCAKTRNANTLRRGGACPRFARRTVVCQSPPALRSKLIVLLGFLVFPLVVPFVYSLVRQPIYVVGRYDFIAHPAWLGLMGIGLYRLQEWLEGVGGAGRRLAAFLPAGIVAALAVRALAPVYAPLPAGVRHHPQTERGLLLAKHATRDDLIVCLGQEGAKIGYQMLLRDIPSDMMTFPLSTRRHFGWFNPREVMEQEGPGLVQEAHAILAQFLPPQPRYRRLWLVRDPYSSRPPPPGAGRNYYAEISDILHSALAGQKWTATSPDGNDSESRSLGIDAFVPPRPPK